MTLKSPFQPKLLHLYDPQAAVASLTWEVWITRTIWELVLHKSSCNLVMLVSAM